MGCIWSRYREPWLEAFTCQNASTTYPRIWLVMVPEKNCTESTQPAAQEPVIAYHRRRGKLQHCLRIALHKLRKIILKARWRALEGNVVPDPPHSAQPWPENDLVDGYGTPSSHDALDDAASVDNSRPGTIELSPPTEVRPSMLSKSSSPSSLHLYCGQPGPPSSSGTPSRTTATRRLVRRASEASQCSEIQPAHSSEQTPSKLPPNPFANVRKPGLGPPPVFFVGEQAQCSSPAGAKGLGAAAAAEGKTLSRSSPAQFRTTDLDCAAGTRLQQQSLVTFATPYQSPVRAMAEHTDRRTSSTHVRNEDYAAASRQHVALRAFLAPVFERRSRLTV